MSKQYEKHRLSRWVRDDEIGRVTVWLRGFRAALQPLDLPGATVRYGDKRTLQEWVRPDGSLLLELADKMVPQATKTARLVPQTLLHLQVLLPSDAQSFGISQDVLDRLVATFNAFIDPKPTAKASAVTLVEFLAHLTEVMKAIPSDSKDRDWFSIHAKGAVARIGTVTLSEQQRLLAGNLVEQMIRHQEKLTIAYRRFLHADKVRIALRKGTFEWSDVHIACRLYAWAMGINVFFW